MILSIFINPTVRLILSLIVLIVLAYILIKFRANKNSRGDSLDILQERLEKGEITQEDYDEAKRRRGKK
ncbi:MAG TPA: SHOCT domain-containing protein [Candidatus Avamphibacillus sp.]|nr:SHOCT domain-containing protein [Candidatus Avamphibacillus sp.]